MHRHTLQLPSKSYYEHSSRDERASVYLKKHGFILQSYIKHVDGLVWLALLKTRKPPDGGLGLDNTDAF